MISKCLAIAAAVAFLSAVGAGQGFAQQTNNQPAAAAPAPAQPANNAAPNAGTDNSAAAAPAPAATDAPAPAITPPATPAGGSVTGQNNPYGLYAFVKNGDFVIRAVVAILAIMSVGTWYIFFMKFWEQSRVLSHSKVVERRFWSSANLNEGIDKLPKNSLFRSVAESGVRASSGQGTGLVNLNDWIGMSLNRQLEEANSRLQGGIAFLASVGSVAPFVGLFGTVWGILKALISIGVAGQASIDKVAGPVGEALIATAIGLFVAVPAVLCYNYLVRRNKVINERLRSFASDLQTYLITNNTTRNTKGA
ncbi:MAG TPA: MotA/TolQ/ExbB proton channel family protein [Rhizomicrobium sp.]|jgi:biopolymer transport protein ExbB|nr:MotA/TolQ/ExbB proton channel family protein [Rhizomicrobium sp.]